MRGIDSLANWSYHRRQFSQTIEKEEKKTMAMYLRDALRGLGKQFGSTRRNGEAPCPLRFSAKSRQRLGWTRYLCGLGR